MIVSANYVLCGLALAVSLNACGHEALLGAQCAEGDVACRRSRGGAAAPVLEVDAAAPPAIDEPVPDASVIDAAPPPFACGQPLVFQVSSCSLDSGIAGAPYLEPGKAYAVHLRSNLPADAVIQLQGWTGCLATGLENVTLPAGPNEQDVCIAATPEERWLMIGIVAGFDFAIGTPEGLNGDVCEGCVAQP